MLQYGQVGYDRNRSDIHVVDLLTVWPLWLYDHNLIMLLYISYQVLGIAFFDIIFHYNLCVQFLGPGGAVGQNRKLTKKKFVFICLLICLHLLPQRNIFHIFELYELYFISVNVHKVQAKNKVHKVRISQLQHKISFETEIRVKVTDQENKAGESRGEVETGSFHFPFDRINRN